MKVLVCGGRDYADREAVAAVLKDIHLRHGISVVIEGGATGADRLAADWAAHSGIHYARVPALWGKYGNSAGPKRNAAMLALKPDLVVAFLGGRGTANMVQQAKDAGIEVMEQKPLNGDASTKRDGA